MTPDGFLPANFAIANEAKSGIELLKELTRATAPSNPPIMLGVAWAIVMPDEGQQYENVLLNYFKANEYETVKHLVQNVSGIDLVFFTNEHYYDRFAGKVIDYTPAGGFFLREPRYAWENPPKLTSRKPKPKAKPPYRNPAGANDNA